MLSKENFKEADKETARIMLWIARQEEGCLPEEDIGKFPCRDLCTIDQLWLAASGGKFGFSVQKQIWIECGGRPGADFGAYDDYGTIEKFYEDVGWEVGDSEVYNLCWDLRGSRGHLPHPLYPFYGRNGAELEQYIDGNLFNLTHIALFTRADVCKL